MNKLNALKDKLIVVIDDEPDILEILDYNFTKERAKVETFELGMDGLNFVRNQQPDAIICDWMLHDLDGIEICKIVKNDKALNQIPFIILTAKSGEINAVLALEMGADDYVTKPVRVKELISRTNRLIKAKERLNNQLVAPTENIDENIPFDEPKDSLLFKGFKLDTEKYKVHLNDIELELTHSEFKLLHLFINKPGKVFTRNQIIEKLNGLDYIVTERSIDVQIAGLRKKLGKFKDHIETVRGVGYRLKE